MADKELRNDKIWRSVVLIILSSLIYLLSFYQGRQSLQPQMEDLRRERSLETEASDQEIRRLRAALADCGERAPVRAAGPLDRIPLRVNQSRILFNGRLVVSLLEVNRPENQAALQINFIQEERLLISKLAAGGSFRFTLDDRNWALVVSSLSTSSANLNLVELKEP